MITMKQTTKFDDGTWKTELRKISDLKPNPKNPRTITKDTIKPLRQSMRDNGYTDRIMNRPGGNRPYEPRGPIKSIQGTDRIHRHRHCPRGKNQEKRPAQHNETNQTAGTTDSQFVRRGRHCCRFLCWIRFNPDCSRANRQNMLLQRT